MAAAAMATSSAPPTSRRTSIGSVMPAMRRTACLHGGALAGESLVVDAGAAADPGRRLAAGERAAAIAAAAWCCRCPSRRARAGRSRVARRRRCAVCTTSSNALRSQRRSRTGCRRSGRPTPTSIAVTSAPAMRAKRVDRRASLRGYAASIAAVTSVGIGADRRRRGHAVVGGEDQRRPAVATAGRSVRCQPATHCGDLVEPGQRAARSEDVWPRGRAPRRGRSRRPGRATS